jgi:hypothetical protein
MASRNLVKACPSCALLPGVRRLGCSRHFGDGIPSRVQQSDVIPAMPAIGATPAPVPAPACAAWWLRLPLAQAEKKVEQQQEAEREREEGGDSHWETHRRY